MKIEHYTRSGIMIGAMLMFALSMAQPSLADSKWEELLNDGKLRQGITTAISEGVEVDKIAEVAVDEKYPVCDILIAMLKEKIDPYSALKAIIAAEGDLKHLAICCSEPSVDIPSALFARVALDAGIDDKVVERLLRIAFTPQPGESGAFTQESVVAGGEIREGPFASPYAFGDPFPPRDHY